MQTDKARIIVVTAVMSEQVLFKSAEGLLGLYCIGLGSIVASEQDALLTTKTPLNRRQLLEFYRELEQSTEQRVERVLRLWWQQSEQQ